MPPGSHNSPDRSTSEPAKVTSILTSKNIIRSVLPEFEFYINGITQGIYFCIWLHSFDNMLVIWIQGVVYNILHSFAFYYISNVFNPFYFKRPFIDCFQILATINSAAIHHYACLLVHICTHFCWLYT